MYVSTSQAAEILNISTSRMRYLITQGRVKGAYKVGRTWIIPLFEGNPIISRGWKLFANTYPHLVKFIQILYICN